jgi:hypothetical protein
MYDQIWWHKREENLQKTENNEIQLFLSFHIGGEGGG